MSEMHTVEQGEYLASIAQDYGFADWHTIYNHVNNAELKKQRPNPDLLLAGDKVYIPDKQDKEDSCSTEQRSKFQIKAPKVGLKIILNDSDGNAMANEPYKLNVGERAYDGSTDGNGLMHQEIPIGEQDGILTLTKLGLTWNLKIGHLDPLHDDGQDQAILTGIQARLNNLGFHCGGVDGNMSTDTEDALREFQKKYSLPVSGLPDKATRSKLEELHGS